MAIVIAIYDALILRGLLYLAGATLVFVTFATIGDVTIRTLGLQPPFWTSALVEYAMLFLTMTAAPGLVRSHGHITVDTLLYALPLPTRRIVSAAVLVASCIVCLIIAFYAAKLGYSIYSRGEMDIRSISIPRWVLYSFIFGGFSLCAIEFARLFILRDFAGDTPAEEL
jgi:C4-dicarboxylate transporter DctQ subunit